VLVRLEAEGKRRRRIEEEAKEAVGKTKIEKTVADA
jgi:hypothetical protein